LVTEAVREKDRRIFMQLWRVRRFLDPALQPDGILPMAAAASKPAGEAFIEKLV
jgi:N-ethylmaleimide reductase